MHPRPPADRTDPPPPPDDPRTGAGPGAFLIPSVFGDEPPLRDLRRRLRDAFRLDLLALPDAGAPGRLLTDMAATGRHLAAEIERRQPAGPLALVGFSFGASAALEVAAQLAEAGRAIAFLGILDGPFEPPEAGIRPAHRPMLEAPRKALKSAAVDAAESLGAVRSLIERAAQPGSPAGGRAEPLRRAMLWHLRSKALNGWTPRPCTAPGLHISTGAFGPSNRARWAALCPGLAHVEIAAVHEHLLKGEALEAVTAALSAALARAAPPG